MKPIYTKVFSRERPLLHLQLWYWGEATDPRLWTSESQPYLPYIVFHRIGHTVDAYYDLRGIEWIKNFILEKMKTDPAYVRKMAAEYAKYVEGKKELISKLPALPLPELIEMAEGVRFSWPYLEIGWWAVEALEDKPEYAADLEFFLDIRKKTEPDTTANEQIIIKSLKPAFPLQEKYVRVISFEEAKSGTLPSGEVLESRLKNYFYTNDTLYEEKTLEDIEKIFNIEFERSPDPQSVTELKGQIAYKGKVQGKVRKIFSSEDIPTFETGEILVATSTVPDFLLAMIKCAGIVTDEGGLISHAAIVARELQKPCIIGTKIATQILMDGDMVEVDANNGIVRKLS